MRFLITISDNLAYFIISRSPLGQLFSRDCYKSPATFHVFER